VGSSPASDATGVAGLAPAGAPAFALVGPGGVVERRTPTLSERGFAAVLADDVHRSALDRVLGGELEQVTISSGEVRIVVERARSADGASRALATVIADPHASAKPEDALAAWLDQSPAVAWLKDLQGRYLHVNGRYTERFGIALDGILGRTDAELEPGQAVDGLRVSAGRPPSDEPLQLEYTIAALDDRPALVALRFPVRDRDGIPIAVCGIAAPAARAAAARQECGRLLRVERWPRLSSEAVKGELLEYWGLTQDPAHADGCPGAQVDRRPNVGDADLAAATDARDAALAANALLELQLAEERRRVVSMREATATAAQRADELLSEMAEARARADALERQGEQACVRVAELEQLLDDERRRVGAIEQAGEARTASASQQRDFEVLAAALADEREAGAAVRAELAAAREELNRAHRAVPAPAVEPDVPTPAHPTNGSGAPQSILRWPATAQRSLALTLAGASEWRTGLKDAIKVLGTDGGWDAVAAWTPDERGKLLKCSAMWTAGEGLRNFETATWQKPMPPCGSALGDSLGARHPRWLTDFAAGEDARLQAAAQEGIRSVLLVPLREGTTPIGALELLSRASVPADAEVSAAVEAVALQLGHFSSLLRHGAEPRWRLGRL
jgi:PAS domain-containing protein